jgi:hypothetical protein
MPALYVFRAEGQTLKVYPYTIFLTQILNIHACRKLSVKLRYPKAMTQRYGRGKICLPKQD